MRITTFFAAVALFIVMAAPANACKGPPQPKHAFWPSAPKVINQGEVALEVVLVRHLTQEEFWAKHPTTGRVVIISCGGYARSTYRIVRVLGGDYKGPSEIDTEVYGGIVDEFNTGQSRIIVGTLDPSYAGPGFFKIRTWGEPSWLGAEPFPVPEIRLNCSSC